MNDIDFKQLEQLTNNFRVTNNSRACPLCNAREPSVIASMTAEQIVESSPYYGPSDYRRLEVKPNDSMGISRCPECSFVFASAVPDKDFLTRLYSSSDETGMAVGVFARPSRAAYAFGVLCKLLERLDGRFSPRQEYDKEPLRILDVGCAFGVGVAGLTGLHYPYEISGVEISQQAREYLAQHNMKVYQNLHDIPEGESYHGIILSDVVEHVPEPRQFIELCAQRLHEKGLIWVNVPNFTEWRLDDAIARVNAGRYDVPKDMNPWEHLSYFSPSSLDTLMGQFDLSRVDSPQVEYPIQRNENAIKTLLRMLRDFLRIRNGNYPNHYTTHGFFERTPR